MEYIEWIVFTYNIWNWNKTSDDVYDKQVILMFNVDIPDIVIPVVPIPPVHSTSLGSGSHSPFPIQVDELDPLSICPEGQMNIIIWPSSTGSS